MIKQRKYEVLVVFIFLFSQLISSIDTSKFDERRQYILNFYSSAYPDTIHYRGDDDIKTAMGFALARLETKQEVKKALNMIERMQDRGFDMFDRHQNIDAYLRFSHLYSPKLKAKVKAGLTNFDYTNNGTTENHKLMFKTAGYLTAQTFPDWKDAAKTREHCRSELLKIMETTVKYGIKEFDSPTYGTFYITCLLSLYDHCLDTELKNKVKITLEWHLLNFAPEWLNGYLISSSLREYFFTCSPRLESPYPIIGWLLFGGPVPQLEHKVIQGVLGVNEGFFSVLVALSSYRLPLIIEKIATDRQKRYVHKESHDMNPYSQLNYPWGFKKYTFINKSYGLASQWDGLSLGWSAQMRRWKLTWESDAPASTFFTTHPCSYEDAATNLRGATPREQVLQHKSTLLAMYKIESGEPYPYITGVVPWEAIKEMEEDPSGWIFFNGGSVFFAVKFTHPYKWTEDRYFKGIRHKILQCNERNAGVVIETCLPEEYGDKGEKNAFASFMKNILEQTAFEYVQKAGDHAKIIYRSLKGDKLELVFNRGRYINGQQVDYTSWPLLSDPWMHQSVEGRFLNISYGNLFRVYDFERWTINEK